jgi:photosystem II stability/assembly factor-like uncharacterized protein
MAPTPAEDGGSSPRTERFGGFRNAGDSVLALYAGQASGQPGEAPATLVEQTSDGGQTWRTGSLSCPAEGPCLQWSAAPNAISGMGVSLPQFVLRSTDNGQTWTSTGNSVELHMGGPNQLAALSADRAVLISGGAQYPLMVTQDGGQTWQAYALPSLPGASQDTGFQFNALQILPDGSLVAMPVDRGTWYALPPGAQDWCQTSVTNSGNSPYLLQFAGGKAWVVEPGVNPGDQSLSSIGLSNFRCK